mgnify:CR=1 FL=1
MTTWLRHSLATLLLFPLLALPLHAQNCRPDRVDLRGPWGKVSFQVEIADDEDSRARGLMYREHLPRGQGMLFVYPQPQPARFWMRNTYIPLDLLFLNESGAVTHIHEQAIPKDLTPIYGGDKVFAVLEINGGLAARYGLSVGSEMRHEVFSNHGPIWPC